MKELVVNPAVPYSYSQMLRDILRLKDRYPKLIASKNAGFSVEGRQLPLITLGTGRTKVFACGAHHAREYISSAYLMYVLNTYADAAQRGVKFGKYDMRSLLRGCSLFVMPMVNPDGVRLVQGGLKAVQDRESVAAMMKIRPTYAEWKANINGVDLNRQYPALWAQKNVVADTPASELYNGEAPATEPEVRAVMRVCRNYRLRSAVSFHTKGEVIYYADENTNNRIVNAKAMAQRVAKVSGYALMPVSEDPGVYAAGFENWFRQAFLYPALLVELSPSSGGTLPHDDKQFFSLVWRKAKFICAEMMRATLDTLVRL